MQITAQEVVLEDVDVAAAILDYINKNHVAGIVLGASKRSPTARCIYIYILVFGRDASGKPIVLRKCTLNTFLVFCLM